ncbi:hypothetical protein SCOR_04815 [Sulfidibacter corallicola]
MGAGKGKEGHKPLADDRPAQILFGKEEMMRENGPFTDRARCAPPVCPDGARRGPTGKESRGRMPGIPPGAGAVASGCRAMVDLLNEKTYSDRLWERSLTVGRGGSDRA